MQIENESELIEIFKSVYNLEEQATDLRKEANDNLKSYAEQIEVDPKILKSVYATFKKYASGKEYQGDCEDFETLSNIVNQYFND